MAAAVAVATVTDERNTWTAGDKYFVLGTVAISASPATYTTGGIAFSLFAPLIKARRTPLWVQFTSTGSGATGTVFDYAYIPGVDGSAGLLKIFTGGAGGTAGFPELTNGTAIPADVSGDTITFFAIFTGQN